MQYRLVQTRKGLVPINEIKKSTHVLCKDGWKISPRPEIRPCIKCTFNALPTTIFEKEFVKDYVKCSNEITLQKGEPKYELSIRGYFNENNFSTSKTSLNFSSEMSYFLPRFIRYFNAPASITLSKNLMYIIDIKKKKFEELYGEQLSERNLEYYLEGLLRRNMSRDGNTYYVTNRLCETDKLVMRLLKIDIKFLHYKNEISNYYEFIKHIKDDYNKNRITPRSIEYIIKNRVLLYKISDPIFINEKTECEDWCLPGINPVINTLIPF